MISVRGSHCKYSPQAPRIQLSHCVSLLQCSTQCLCFTALLVDSPRTCTSDTKQGRLATLSHKSQCVCTPPSPPTKLGFPQLSGFLHLLFTICKQVGLHSFLHRLHQVVLISEYRRRLDKTFRGPQMAYPSIKPTL